MLINLHWTPKKNLQFTYEFKFSTSYSTPPLKRVGFLTLVIWPLFPFHAPSTIYLASQPIIFVLDQRKKERERICCIFSSSDQFLFIIISYLPMTPPYSSTNSSSSPFPFELSNEDHDHHQNHTHNFTTTNYHVSSSSSAHSQPSHLFLNPTWYQPQLYCDSDPQFFYPQQHKVYISQNHFIASSKCTYIYCHAVCDHLIFCFFGYMFNLQVDNHAANGGSYDQGPKKQVTLWRSTKKEENCEDSNDHRTHEVIPVKWMSSKMRVMQKMKSSDRAAMGASMASAATTITTTTTVATATAATTTTMKIEDQKRASSSLEPEYSSNSSSNNSSSNNVPIRVCADCNTTKTPLWRSGPKGPKVIKYKPLLLENSSFLFNFFINWSKVEEYLRFFKTFSDHPWLYWCLYINVILIKIYNFF